MRTRTLRTTAMIPPRPHNVRKRASAGLKSMNCVLYRPKIAPVGSVEHSYRRFSKCCVASGHWLIHLRARPPLLRWECEEESITMVAKTQAEYEDRITQDPAIMAGKPVIKGTRVPVERIIAHLAHDPDLDDLFAAYPASQSRTSKQPSPTRMTPWKLDAHA